jgi:phage repressor protein C with HTH and peptisase S24 domain
MSIERIENEQIGRRISQAIGGMPIADAADVAGCSANTLRRWLKGDGAADARSLARLAQRFDCSLMWLLTGLSEESGDELTAMHNLGYAPVPVRDITASAGAGLTALDSEPLLHIGFNRDWLKGIIGNADDASILRIKGDSMEPELKSGDYIMCNPSDAGSRIRDGIYILRLNDQLLVKRVRMTGKGVAELLSTNPAYAPIQVMLADDDFTPVGRVVWSSRVLE